MLAGSHTSGCPDCRALVGGREYRLCAEPRVGRGTALIAAASRFGIEPWRECKLLPQSYRYLVMSPANACDVRAAFFAGPVRLGVDGTLGLGHTAC